MASALTFLQDLSQSLDTVQVDVQLVQRLIGFVVQGDTQEYQLAYNLIRTLAQREGVQSLFTSGEVVDDFARGSEGNSIAAIRILELVVDLSNQSTTLFSSYEAAGLLKTALGVYFTDDLLTKLTSIQIIEKFGDSASSCEYLINSPFMGQLRREFEDPSTDTTTQLSLMVLFAKLHTWTHNYDFSTTYWEILTSSLESSSYTLFNYGFSAFCQVAQSPKVRPI